jgi:hypothetical protein
MRQFQGPENDIMGERYLMLYLEISQHIEQKECQDWHDS